MRSMLYGIGAMSLLLPFSASVEAASLRVAPTNIELLAPGSAGVFSLANDGNSAINVQIRVFRWTQIDGVERLDPTSDVVISPPATSLAGGKVYAVRVLRIADQPVAAEESYRVVVDELPDPARKKTGTVSFVVRYSIPVFFKKPDAAPPKITWGLGRVKGKLVVTATNLGDSRLRIADLQLTQKGTVIGGRNGLVGYVLGGARMQWVINADKSVSSGPLTLRGHSDTGPFDAKVAISSR